MRRALATLPLAIALVAMAAACAGTSGGTPTSPTGACVLASISPSQAAVGDSIALSGSGFTPSDNAIRIGAGYLLGVASGDGASLTFTLPATLSPCPPGTQVCVTLVLLVTPGTYQVSVVNAKGTSNELAVKVVDR